MNAQPPPSARAARRPWPLYSLAAVLGLSAAALLIGAVLTLPHAGHGTGAARSFAQALGLAGADPSEWRGPVPAGRSSSGFAWTAQEQARLAAADRGRGAFVARNCAACHGMEGVGGTELAPALAGQPAAALLKQLHDFRSGTRDWPVMNAVARALSEADARAVSAYLASVDAPASACDKAAQAPPSLIMSGDSRRRLPACIACHTPAGELGVSMLAPRLEAQREDYLVRQLELFRAGWRRNDVYGLMRNVARSLNRSEIVDLARWYASAPAARCASRAPSSRGTVSREGESQERDRGAPSLPVGSERSRK